MSSAPAPWECAYGENAWQAPARLVHDDTDDPLALGRFTQIEGAAPSDNNLAALDRQLQTITHLAAAVEILARRHGKCRQLANPALGALDRDSLDTTPRTRPVRGGTLQQPNYTFVLDLDDPDAVRHGELPDDAARDLRLAWAVGATSNSNTTTLVRDGQRLGNGVGQQDRVGGCARRTGTRLLRSLIAECEVRPHRVHDGRLTDREEER